MVKVNNRNTKTRCEIRSKLTIKTPEPRQWRRSGAFIVNFEHISHHALVFIVNVEHVIGGWVVSLHRHFHYPNIRKKKCTRKYYLQAKSVFFPIYCSQEIYRRNYLDADRRKGNWAADLCRHSGIVCYYQKSIEV